MQLTRSPQHLALCVEAGADTAVAVGGAFLAGLAILQEHVGGGSRERYQCSALGGHTPPGAADTSIHLNAAGQTEKIDSRSVKEFMIWTFVQLLVIDHVIV